MCVVQMLYRVQYVVQMLYGTWEYPEVNGLYIGVCVCCTKAVQCRCVVQTLYKTQVRELREELEEKIKELADLDTDAKNLENERYTPLQIYFLKQSTFLGIEMRKITKFTRIRFHALRYKYLGSIVYSSRCYMPKWPK